MLLCELENIGVCMVTRTEHYQTIFPPISTTNGGVLDGRSDLVKQIQKLEAAAEDLGRVRATLLVNFGPERAHDGIVIQEHPSTVHMLFQVCEAYGRKLAESAKSNAVK